MKKQKYNHAEAFCLMWYQCKACGKRELLWNSRDGITPFIIGCKHCGGEAAHVLWGLDQCMPNYKPQPGQRIFIAMTEERAQEIAKKRIEHFDNLGYSIDGVSSEELLRDWHNGENPDIYVEPREGIA